MTKAGLGAAIVDLPANGPATQSNLPCSSPMARFVVSIWPSLHFQMAQKPLSSYMKQSRFACLIHDGGWRMISAQKLG